MSDEPMDEEFDPISHLSGPLMKKVLEEVAKDRHLQDSRMGFFRDYRDGTAGRMTQGPTISRDVERAKETLLALKDAEKTGQMTWRHLLEDSFALAMSKGTDVHLRYALLSLAAHSVSWIEAIDRRKDEKRIEIKRRPSRWAKLGAWFRRLFTRRF